jgi:hypothetical protein
VAAGAVFPLSLKIFIFSSTGLAGPGRFVFTPVGAAVLFPFTGTVPVLTFGTTTGVIFVFGGFTLAGLFVFELFAFGAVPPQAAAKTAAAAINKAITLRFIKLTPYYV